MPPLDSLAPNTASGSTLAPAARRQGRRRPAPAAAKIVSPMQALARALAGNCRRVHSLGGPDHHGGCSQRVVVIVGAGASHAAAGLPLGKDLAAELVRQLECDREPNNQKFDEWLGFMKREHGFHPEDFKTILFSLNKIDSPRLVAGVQAALLNKRAHNSTYTILAKMFAEGCFDAIINFNFDELLDDEIKQAFAHRRPYTRVYSEETCRTEIGRKLDEAELPLYLKPHGTISEGHTLRFVREDFHRIQGRQMNLIHELLSQAPVRLVVVGFRLKFPEFSKVVALSLPVGSEITIVDRHADILDDNLNAFYRDGLLQVTERTSLPALLRRLNTETKALLRSATQASV